MPVVPPVPTVEDRLTKKTLASLALLLDGASLRRDRAIVRGAM